MEFRLIWVGRVLKRGVSRSVCNLIRTFDRFPQRHPDVRPALDTLSRRRTVPVDAHVEAEARPSTNQTLVTTEEWIPLLMVAL